MTAEGWRELVMEATRRAHVGKLELLNLLSELLAEQDAAKARLCERFACAGRPWPDLVDDIIDAAARETRMKDFTSTITSEHVPNGVRIVMTLRPLPAWPPAWLGWQA